jgi:N-dimethylarginine dimethylaminohydrolase
VKDMTIPVPASRPSAGPRRSGALRSVTALPGARIARPRHYLMCRPTHFTVSYTINPWMDPSIPVDRELAMRQWENLRDVYRSLGHTVSFIEPLPGLPDMVFAANGGLVVDGKALGARFAKEQRAAEGPAYLQWLQADEGCVEFATTEAYNEGEGDFLTLADVILAGTGFRTDRAAHAEAQEFLGKPVISLTLVDPNFYHLDTALAVLGDHDIAYYPAAFSPGSQAVLRRMFPDAVIATTDDARAFGLNSVSDGYNVVVPVQARDLIASLEARGYHPVPVDMSEFRKSGGGPKCCTLELRPFPFAVNSEVGS